MTEGDIQIQIEPLRERPNLEDIVGKPKKFCKRFIRDSQGEGVYKSMGVNPDKVFLLEGPPGTGKTMAIDAIYNTINREAYAEYKKKIEEYQNRSLMSFEPDDEDVIEMEDGEIKNKSKFPTVQPEDLNLVLFRYDLGKYGTAYINRGCRVVQNFFDYAGIHAAYGIPTLIEIDEAESLLGKRGGRQSHKEDDKVLTTIMKNLQLCHDRPNMYVALISNIPEICDEASLRSGRVDRRVRFDLPDDFERKKAYEHFIDNANQRAGYAVVRGYELDNLVELSDGFNYADIKNTVDSAIKKRASEILDERTDEIIPAGYIKGGRLEKSIKNHKDKFHKETGIKGFGK